MASKSPNAPDILRYSMFNMVGNPFSMDDI
jgi:hypothetical protein